MTWLFSQAMVKACASSPCSLEPVEASSAASSSDGQPSAQLNVMPTQHKFWRNDKTMEPSSLSRFGLTCEVLTEDRGQELLTSYLAGFRARTSASQVLETGSTAPAPACGESLRGWFATFDRSSSTWRTAQRSLLGDSESFSETWPRWGSMLDGVSYLQPTPALPICESESGLWQTPVADDAVERKAGKWNSRGEPKLSAEVKLWPTPMASDWRSGKASQATHDKNSRPLREAVAKYPTPSTIGINGGSHSRAAAVKRGQDVKEVNGGSLNPTWVEWLMGWPLGWTDLKPLETARFQEWQQQHGDFSEAR